MRIVRYALLGIAAYLVILLATAPASVAVAALRVAELELHDVRGSIWSGAARAVVRMPAAAIPIDEVRWRFAPARLLAGRISFDVQASAPILKAAGEIARGFRGDEVRELVATSDAALLGSLVPLLGTWRPQGQLKIEAPLLAWDARELRGNARAEWRGATLSFPDPRALGTYVASVKGDGGPAKVTIATTEGALRLAGEGTVSPPGRFALRGEARAEPAAAAQLEPLLNLLGPARADGARSFDWRAP